MERVVTQIAIQTESGGLIPIAWSFDKGLAQDVAKRIVAELERKKPPSEPTLRAAWQSTIEHVRNTLKAAGVL